MNEFCQRLTEAGWRDLREYEGLGFGSWMIELAVDLRVEYNGKDELLGLYRQTSQDNWRKIWTARQTDQTPAALLDALRAAGRSTP